MRLRAAIFATAFTLSTATIPLAILVAQTPAQKSAEMSPQPPAATSPAQPPADADMEAAKYLIGHPLFLRCLCEDGKLAYDAQGKPAEPAKKHVDWTLAGFDIQDVKRIDATHLEISGPRIAIKYNEGGKIFERHPLKLTTIKVTVATTSQPGTLRKALADIFADGIDYRLQQSTVPAWQHYFNPQMPWGNDALVNATIYALNGQPGSSIAPPKATHTSEVEMTMEAAQSRITGGVQLRIVVDASGVPHRIAIARPLGYGLDEKAAESVMKWRFSPATREGKPITATATIEQRFSAPQPVPSM